MKDVEIFFFDVDGTLLNNHNHTISEATKTALKQLKENNYKVALCTGRNYEGILDLDLIDLIEWDAFILANGSQIMDSNLNLIKEIHFEQDLIHKMDAALDDALLLEGDINFITKDASQKILDAYAHFGIEPLPTKPYENEKVFNVLCYNFDEFEGELLEEIKAKCDLFEDQLGNMEIINIESGKHNAIQFVNDYLNTSRYAGFGDGENDVKFLANAPISVAMGNGCDNAKNVASHVAPSVDEDGIYHTLKEFGVI